VSQRYRFDLRFTGPLTPSGQSFRPAATGGTISDQPQQIGGRWPTDPVSEGRAKRLVKAKLAKSHVSYRYHGPFRWSAWLKKVAPIQRFPSSACDVRGRTFRRWDLSFALSSHFRQEPLADAPS
jgi:hypothetical protein